MTTEPGQAGFTEKQPFHVQPRSGFLAKNAFYPQKTPELLMMFILEKGTFFFEQLFLVVARTWLELRSELFLDP